MIVSVNAEKALKKIHEEKVQSTRKRKEFLQHNKGQL